MPIAKFINATEIQKIFNEQNPTNKIGYPTALKWKHQIVEEHKNEILPNNKVIPLSWFLDKFGEDVYKKKDV